MLDIAKSAIDLKCSSCKKTHTITLKQVADERIITCSCGNRIQLKDVNHNGRNAIRDINKSLEKLQKTFKNIGKR